MAKALELLRKQKEEQEKLEREAEELRKIEEEEERLRIEEEERIEAEEKRRKEEKKKVYTFILFFILSLYTKYVINIINVPIT